MGGLTIDKILIVLVIAMIILGPERLPYYAKKLGELVKNVKSMANGAKDRLKDEMGPEFDDVNWKQLDPRQYDPRRIIRDALLEDEKDAQAEARKQRAVAASEARRARATTLGLNSDTVTASGATVAAAAVGVAGVGVAAGDAQVRQEKPADVPEQSGVFFDEEAT